MASILSEDIINKLVAALPEGQHVLDQDDQNFLIGKLGEQNPIEVAIVTRCLVNIDGNDYWLVIRNLVKEAVTRIENKYHLSREKRVTYDVNAVLQDIDLNPTAERKSSFNLGYSEVIDLAKDTVMGSPSEKIKERDFIYFDHLYGGYEYTKEEKVQLVLLIAFIRGLMEEVPELIKRGLRPRELRIKESSFIRNDKILCLAEATMEPMTGIQPEIDSAINEHAKLVYSWDMTTARVNWGDRTIGDATSVPKDLSGILVTIPEAESYIRAARRNPKDDKPEVLIKSWRSDATYLYYPPECINLVWDFLYECIIENKEKPEYIDFQLLKDYRGQF